MGRANKRYVLLLASCISLALCQSANSLGKYAPSGFVDVGTFVGNGASVNGINGEGNVAVGSFVTDDGTHHAFVWHWPSLIDDLGTMGGTSAEAFGVSDDGSVVVGSFDDSQGLTHAFRWKAGAVQDLGAFGGIQSVAYGVSSDGTAVVGKFSDKDYVAHAFLWTISGTSQDLGLLGGSSAEAHAVWDGGARVAGLFRDANRKMHVFTWTQSTGPQDLGEILAPSAVTPSNVSGAGSVVVGSAVTTSMSSAAFIWSPSSGIQSLNWKGAVSADARAVSRDGTIIGGSYTDAGNAVHAYIFVSPLSSPSSVVIAPATIPQAQSRQPAEPARPPSTVSSPDVAAPASKPAMAEGATSTPSVSPAPHQSESAAKAAPPDALTAEEQTRFARMKKSGKPAQIYAMALNMEKRERADLAVELYNALVDRYPEDLYTRKAIEKMEEAQKSAKQERMAREEQVATEARAREYQAAVDARERVSRERAEREAAQRQQEARQMQEERVAACRNQCDTVAQVCQNRVAKLNSNAMIGIVVGGLTRNNALSNSGMDQAAAADSVDCGGTQSICYTTCQ